MTRTLTIQQLEQAGAGEDQVEVFRETFGEFALVKAELAESLATPLGFSWATAACLLPDDASRKEFARARDSAQATFRHARVAAWKEYERVCKAAQAKSDLTLAEVQAEYQRASSAAAWAKLESDRAEALTELDRVLGTAWKNYWRIFNAARAECDRVCAREFARLYSLDREGAET